ncbi:MAG TPA: septum formation initiator family protein [Candidatus Saccharimonadales bacterium]|nr:septum formation initiator family protein [Candidatus Saccharimonadales bacterium]
MQEKIKQYQKMIYEYAGDLRDVRVAGLVVFLVVALLISWSGIKVINTNYTLQKQISQLQQQTRVQQLEDNNLKLQNQYFNTNQYLDITARQEFGLAAPGEKIVVVPTSVALAHTVDVPSLAQKEKTTTVNHQPAYQRNFQAWMDFFFHRQPAQE